MLMLEAIETCVQAEGVLVEMKVNEVLNQAVGQRQLNSGTSLDAGP